MAKRSYCDGIRDCEDGIDEPDSCLQSTLFSLTNFLHEFKKVYGDITGALNPKSTYGPIFGGIIGIIVLFFSLLTLVAVTMTLCVCNKHCPIYKWRQRRGQPPVGVMIATEVPGSEATIHLNHDPQEDSALIIGIVLAIVAVTSIYRIAGNIGRELNLAVWRSSYITTAKFNSCQYFRLYGTSYYIQPLS